MPIIETEIWKPNPAQPGTIIFDSYRTAQDIFNELKAHLKADGRLPDEYFDFNAWSNWKDNAVFPKDADIICNVNYGGSEGIYLSISVRYEKDVYEYNKEDNGVSGWHKRRVTEHFATGKTLGDTIDDLDKMHLVASSVTAAFYGYKPRVQERYAQIESGEVQPVYLSAEQQKIVSETEKATKTLYGIVKADDWVIAMPPDEHAYLTGKVIEVAIAGTPEHDGFNDRDYVLVDFTTADYSDTRKTELLKDFENIYPDAETLDDLLFKRVIMAPGNLVRISNLSMDEINRMANIQENAEAFCNIFISPQRENPKFYELAERVEKNYSDYNKSLLGFGKAELIEMAGKIQAMSDAHSYLTAYHRFDESELDFFLQFENPLEVVADDWKERNDDLDEMNYTIDNIINHSDPILEGYELIKSSDTLNIASEMDGEEFAGNIAVIIPDGDLEAVDNLIRYTNDLDKDGIFPKNDYFRDYLTEFDSVAQDYGKETARQLLDVCKTVALNPSELREAATHIRDGTEPEKIIDMALNGHYNKMVAEKAEQADVHVSNNLSRFMDVDVIDFIGKISEKVMADDPDMESLNKLKGALTKAAAQDGFENRRIIWHIGSETSRLRNECEIFVKGSRAAEYGAEIQDFDKNTLVYAIEFTKREDKTIIGNVFEIGGFLEHTERVRNKALPLDSVTLSYQDAWGAYSGKKVTVTPENFAENRDWFMEKGGNVVLLQFNPTDNKALTEILNQERAARMSYPIGSTEEHLQKLDERLSNSQTTPEKAEHSDYNDNGKKIIPAIHLPEGWEWRISDDGNGGLYSPDNRQIYEMNFAPSSHETVSSNPLMEITEISIRNSLEREPVKPKTLNEKMKAANKKVKAQDAQNNNKKTPKREERE